MSKFLKLPDTATRREGVANALAGWMLNIDTIMMFWQEEIRGVLTLRILCDYGPIDIPEMQDGKTSDLEAVILQITS
jgi:hypothetical protein